MHVLNNPPLFGPTRDLSALPLNSATETGTPLANEGGHVVVPEAGTDIERHGLVVNLPTQIMRIVARQPGRLHLVHGIASRRRANASSRNVAVWWDSGAGLGANGPQEAFVRLGQHRQGLQIR